MPTYCIICGKSRTGLLVEEDYIINALRWFKRNVTKDEQKNKLVVCKEDYATYNKNRKRYLSRQALYLGIGVIFLLITIAISFSSGKFGGILFGLFCLLVLFLISLLNYTPALKIGDQNLSSNKHNQ